MNNKELISILEPLILNIHLSSKILFTKSGKRAASIGSAYNSLIKNYSGNDWVNDKILHDNLVAVLKNIKVQLRRTEKELIKRYLDEGLNQSDAQGAAQADFIRENIDPVKFEALHPKKSNPRKPDTRSYKNFEFWPTKKLLEVINEPYNRGTDGHDYQPYIEEIQQVYWERMNKEDINKMIKNRFKSNPGRTIMKRPKKRKNPDYNYTYFIFKPVTTAGGDSDIEILSEAKLESEGDEKVYRYARSFERMWSELHFETAQEALAALRYFKENKEVEFNRGIRKPIYIVNPDIVTDLYLNDTIIRGKDVIEVVGGEEVDDNDYSDYIKTVAYIGYYRTGTLDDNEEY